MKKYTLVFIPSDPKLGAVQFVDITSLTFTNATGKIEKISNEQLDSYELPLSGVYHLYSDEKSQGTVNARIMMAIQKDECESIPSEFFDEMNK